MKDIDRQIHVFTLYNDRHTQWHTQWFMVLLLLLFMYYTCIVITDIQVFLTISCWNSRECYFFGRFPFQYLTLFLNEPGN